MCTEDNKQPKYVVMKVSSSRTMGRRRQMNNLNEAVRKDLINCRVTNNMTLKKFHKAWPNIWDTDLAMIKFITNGIGTFQGLHNAQ